ENLRTGAVIDYKTSLVTPEDLRNIFSGTVTERTPAVIHGSPGTNVFLFWSGHGARDEVLMWADDKLEAETFRGILEGAEGNYRKLLAVMETCYSGSIGSFCEGLPGVLLLCATRSGETSHADVMEDGIYLSNRFTRVFRSEVEANPSISLHDLYYQLATHTTASHAGLYNDNFYGNVYRNTLGEFLIPRVGVNK
ncbi:MAG: legumain, partial [Bacteroidales bacterium]|nr:legumain [Bacteroidales bacterium]